ncbi:MAG: excinuclease ABC subunit UvrC [Oscillospiraceae bacterium]|nr:excinuclease ABC subunit UvrC [Oscillospiraceae bacterium]
MKDKQGKIIYIGKAKQLKNRVSTYFAAPAKRDRKTLRLVERIRDFDYIVTPKELDAFVLETSLIKQHRPKYNILLKDAKGFNYIKITKGAYPRLLYVLSVGGKAGKAVKMKRRGSGSSDLSGFGENEEYLGPYVGGFFVKQSVEDANRIFMLPSCNRRFPEDFNKSRACLNYRIKRCMGVCLGNISQEEYRGVINSAIDYIRNGSKASVAALTEEMEQAAEKLEFEKAARLRDRINAMKRIDTVQSVISSKQTDYDVIAAACELGKTVAAVIKYSGGRLIDKECFYLGDDYDLSDMAEWLGSFLKEYYSDIAPTEIYVETEIQDKELFEEYLKGKFAHKVKITVPKRGEGLAQIMLAKSNAAEFLSLKVGRKSKEIAVLEQLAELLGLNAPPEYIECYDISNIGATTKVGGMVVYRNGKPFKQAYRKFTIKDVDGLDDYACMREVVRRRYSGTLSTEMPLPDLILIDGGAAHVSAVRSVLSELGLDINLFGLVKDSRHKTRAVVSSEEEIQINSNKSVFALLTKIQDEVHRFSVSFAREKHKKASFTLSLTGVSGIGEKKAAALLNNFKTKKALKEASAEQLGKVAKINIEKAEELKKFIGENL